MSQSGVFFFHFILYQMPHLFTEDLSQLLKTLCSSISKAALSHYLSDGRSNFLLSQLIQASQQRKRQLEIVNEMFYPSKNNYCDGEKKSLCHISFSIILCFIMIWNCFCQCLAIKKFLSSSKTLGVKRNQDYTSNCKSLQLSFPPSDLFNYCNLFPATPPVRVPKMP